jgi:hypothetical protein
MTTRKQPQKKTQPKRPNHYFIVASTPDDLDRNLSFTLVNSLDACSVAWVLYLEGYRVRIWRSNRWLADYR